MNTTRTCRFPTLLLASIGVFGMPGFASMFFDTALAGELAGVTLPDRITVDGTPLVLNGMGLREATLFKVDVYVAGLYLEAKTPDAGAILDGGGRKRIVLRFVRSVGRKDLVKAWSEGFDRNAGDEHAALEARVSTLNSWMTDMGKGDTLVFTDRPGKGVEVEVKGGSKGTITGADFARVLFRIWLGPNPPNAGLKDGLLGHGPGS